MRRTDFRMRVALLAPAIFRVRCTWKVKTESRVAGTLVANRVPPKKGLAAMPPLGLKPLNTVEDLIAKRAYQKWKQRGCPQGDGERDWFDATAEIQAERERRAYEQAIALFD